MIIRYEVRIYCGYYDDHYTTGSFSKQFPTYIEAQLFYDHLYKLLHQKNQHSIDIFLEENFGLTCIVQDTIRIWGIYKIMEEKVL